MGRFNQLQIRAFRLSVHETTLTVRKFIRLAVQSSVWKSENIERSRVNEESGQIFRPFENSLPFRHSLIDNHIIT